MMYRQQFWRATSSYALELQPDLLLLEMRRRLMWRHIISISTCCSILVFFLEASHSSRCGRQSRVLDGSRVRRSLCSYPYAGSANRQDVPVSCASEHNAAQALSSCPGEQVGEDFSWEKSTPPKTWFWQVMAVPTTTSSDRTTLPSIRGPPHHRTHAAAAGLGG